MNESLTSINTFRLCAAYSLHPELSYFISNAILKYIHNQTLGYSDDLLHELDLVSGEMSAGEVPGKFACGALRVHEHEMRRYNSVASTLLN